MATFLQRLACIAQSTSDPFTAAQLQDLLQDLRRREARLTSVRQGLHSLIEQAMAPAQPPSESQASLAKLTKSRAAKAAVETLRVQMLARRKPTR